MPEEVKSLHDELSAAFDSAETETPAAQVPETETPAVEKSATEAPETAETRVRDEHGRFVKQEKVETPAEAQTAAKPETPAETTAETPAAQTQQGADLPPSTWTPAAKAEYAKLPEVVKSELKKREADFQKGISQYKQAAESGDRLMRELQPYMPIIQAEGGTPERAIRQLLNTAYQLRTGTAQERGRLVMQIAQQYGADITPFLQQTGQAQGQAQGIDPNAIAPVVQQLLAPHLQKIDQFQNQFATAQQQREQASQQDTLRQIEAFRSATDDKGQARHVYFDNVRELMASLIDSGQAQSLDQAYEMACRAHPEVSRAMSAEQRSREEAQRLEEARRKAQDAKRAHLATASGQGGVGVIDTAKISLREELEGRLDGRIA